MFSSRLRLRLAAGFAFAIALGLGVLGVGVLGYLWREAGRRLDSRLDVVAQGAASALTRELGDYPERTITAAAHETVGEWPLNDDSFAIVDDNGMLAAAADRTGAIDSVMNARTRWTGPDKFIAAHGTHNIRAVATPVTTVNAGGYTWRFRIIAFHSTEGIESDAELIAGRMAFMLPVIVLLSFIGGYWLAGRALVPATKLRQAIAGLAPNELSRRLPVGKRVDEIGALAVEFNSLLGRLDEAQQQNRRFVLEAAHQIRTPLTLVLGEAGNELATLDSDHDRARSALGRIRTAAEQMRRRVDELFLLAEAQAGEQVRLDDDVELDGLLLECTDLMRGRASALGRTLAIGRAEHIVIRANALLLQEALVEMIENGCRHGTPDAPVTVSAFLSQGAIEVSVQSPGVPFDLPQSHGANGDAPRSGRLGLPIVAWIAHAHGGELRVTRDGDCNIVTIAFQPAVAGATAPRPA